MKPEEKRIVENLNLKPHPEGGFYNENYRSHISIAEKNLPETFGGKRSAATSILFFLPEGAFSAFHRLKQDEIWYFHAGNQPILHCIEPDSTYRKCVLGTGIRKDEYPQVIINAGTLFAAESNQSFGLFGCLATPGFDFADLSMPTAAQLIKEYPEHEKLIRRFTRS